MIENPALVKEFNAMSVKREDLVSQKADLEHQLADMAINQNWVMKFNHHDPKYRAMPIMQKRHELKMKLNIVLDEIRKVNIDISNLREKSNSVENRALIDIFKEMFTGDQLAKIQQEALRRIAGHDPAVIEFGERNKYRDERDLYKKIAKDQVDKMVEFRLLLTKVIEDGCSRFDQSEFMKTISPLNRLIIPVNELNKIKLKNYL